MPRTINPDPVPTKNRIILAQGGTVTPPPIEDPTDGTTTRPVDIGTGTLTMLAPRNLRAEPYYDAVRSQSFCRLRWDPVPNAVKYEILSYGQPLSPPAYTTNVYFELRPDFNLYAVKAHGTTHEIQSLPSAWSKVPGLSAPAPVRSPALNPVPRDLVTSPDWQGDYANGLGLRVSGGPRIVLTWRDSVGLYNVYRNGVLLSSGITLARYIDDTVAAGQTYTYSVSATTAYTLSDYGHSSSIGESAQSTGVSATARTAPYPFLAQKITIHYVQAFHNHVIVFFAPVIGAVDYRAYIVGNEGGWKYAGGYHSQTRSGVTFLSNNNGYGLSIQLSGLVGGERIVVEAVDKLGPYMLHRSGSHRHDGFSYHLNGHGDPSNVPYAIAVSDPTPPIALQRIIPATGDYFEAFLGNQKPVLLPTNSIDSETLAINDGAMEHLDLPKVELYQYLQDRKYSDVMAHHREHLMEIAFDGGGGQHQNNATFQIIPKYIWDISGVKALEFSFFSPPKMVNRKWRELQIVSETDVWLSPGKFAETGLRPSKEANVFRWQQKEGSHFINRFTTPPPGSPFVAHSYDPPTGGAFERVAYDGIPLANGSDREIDKPSFYRVTVSRTRFRVEEYSLFDPTYNFVYESPFAAGQELSFTRAKVGLIHQVYHTDISPQELSDYGTNPQNVRQSVIGNAFDILCNVYWSEGHWHQFHGRSLASFPQTIEPLPFTPYTKP